jgi:hypothetical protein
MLPGKGDLLCLTLSMLMYVSVAALALTVALLVLSLNRTASTLSTLMNVLTAALAQVTALLVLPNSSNLLLLGKTIFRFRTGSFIRACYFLRKIQILLIFFAKGLFFVENMVYNISCFGYNNDNISFSRF